MKNYYEILGVKREASLKDIQKAYWRISLEHHPDKIAEKTEEEKKESNRIFEEVQNAFKTLENKKIRELYDLLLQDEKEKTYVENIINDKIENLLTNLRNSLMANDNGEKEITESINEVKLFKYQNERQELDAKLGKFNKKTEQIAKKIKEIKDYQQEKISINRQKQSFQTINENINKFLNENEKIKNSIYTIAEEIVNIQKEFNNKYYFLKLNDLIVEKTIIVDEKNETQISLQPNIVINNEILEKREKEIYRIISQLEEKIKNVIISIENCKKKIKEQKAWKIEEKINETKTEKQIWKKKIDNKLKRKNFILEQQQVKEIIDQIIDILNDQEELFNEIKKKKTDDLLKIFEKRINGLLKLIKTYTKKIKIKDGEIIIIDQNEITVEGLEDKIENIKKETKKKIEKIKKILQQQKGKTNPFTQKEQKKTIKKSNNNLQQTKVTKKAIRERPDAYQVKSEINNQILKTKKDNLATNYTTIITLKIIAITSFIALIFRLLYFYNKFLFEKYFEKVFNKFFGKEKES